MSALEWNFWKRSRETPCFYRHQNVKVKMKVKYHMAEFLFWKACLKSVFKYHETTNQCHFKYSEIECQLLNGTCSVDPTCSDVCSVGISICIFLRSRTKKDIPSSAPIRKSKHAFLSHHSRSSKQHGYYRGYYYNALPTWRHSGTWFGQKFNICTLLRLKLLVLRAKVLYLDTYFISS